MERSKGVKVLLASLVVLTIVTAGCLGGGDNGAPKKATFTENPGTTGADGEKTLSDPASFESVPVTEKVTITIPNTNVTRVSFTIVVNDGTSEHSDENTQPDDVTGSLEGGGQGGGNTTKTIPGGSTPYKTTVELSAPEGSTLPSSWTVTLNVLCKASEDEWPGPLIWRGYPDYGFSYSINVTYTYLTPA